MLLTVRQPRNKFIRRSARCHLPRRSSENQAGGVHRRDNPSSRNMHTNLCASHWTLDLPGTDATQSPTQGNTAIRYGHDCAHGH